MEVELILTLVATPTVAGTGYAVGDVLAITTGGTDGKVTVLTITGGLGTGPVVRYFYSYSSWQWIYNWSR